MDWVTIQFSDSWLVELGLPPAAKFHGSELGHARNTNARETGHWAAQALASWLAQEQARHAEKVTMETHLTIAKQVTMGLALRLNVADAPLLEKDNLASRLLTIARDQTLQEAVLGWRLGKAPAERLLTLEPMRYPSTP
jgi:hypothetical protein